MDSTVDWIFIVLCCVIWSLPACIECEVASKQDWNRLNKNVKSIHVPSNSCNENSFINLELSVFSNLEQFIVDKGSFGNTERVKIDGLDKLKSIHIADDCFRRTRSVQ